MSGRRDPYADVGRAMRESIERALAADLSGRDLRVLLAFHHRLASWSRLSDRVYTDELCKLCGLKANKVRESVARLVEAGVIWRNPSRGRHPSEYGLPTPSAGSIEHTPETGSIGGGPSPATGSIERPTHPADGVPTLPADGVAAEKAAEKSGGGTHARAGAGAREAAAQGEPPDRQDGETFGKLMTGVGLSGRKLVEMHDFFGTEPDRVRACVEEWWRRKERRSDTGPGLLVRMVEDGDFPGQNGRRPRRAPSPVCPECELSPPHHAADCSLAEASA